MNVGGRPARDSRSLLSGIVQKAPALVVALTGPPGAGKPPTAHWHTVTRTGLAHGPYGAKS